MSTILDSAQTFLWSNGRILERHLFTHLFKEGGRDPVITALLAYQNADGGFGNALEPDKRTPTSQPIDQEMALRVLDDVGFDESIARQICDFLATITTAEGGVPFVLPTVRDAPRAPWWNTDDNPPASINPTASIAGLLHKHGVRHAWLDRATEYCWRPIETAEISEPHALVCAALFLQHVPDRNRAMRAFERVSEQIMNVVALDPHAEGYTHGPLSFAPTPDSLCHTLFSDEVIQAHLDALIARQQADGGWLIAWPTVSPANEYEYRGIVTLGSLKMLKAYARLN